MGVEQMLNLILVALLTIVNRSCFAHLPPHSNSVASAAAIPMAEELRRLGMLEEMQTTERDERFLQQGEVNPNQVADSSLDNAQSSLDSTFNLFDALIILTVILLGSVCCVLVFFLACRVLGTRIRK